MAEKADQIAGYTATAGTMTQYIGKGMMLLGKALSSNPYTAAAGAALISAGATTEKVGTVVETVGNYGKCAANITKTAVFAAKGDIKGALMSAGAAVMSGVSAAKGTKEMANGFKSINEKAAQVSAEAAEKAQAKSVELSSKAAEKTAESTAEGVTEKAADKATDKAAKLTEKAGKLDKATTKLQENADKFTGKVNEQNLAQATKRMEKLKELGNNATEAQKVELSNLEKSINQANGVDAAGNAVEKSFDGVNEYAGKLDSKFEKAIGNGMQAGSFLQSAGSQFAGKPTQQVGGGHHHYVRNGRAQRRGLR